MIFQLRLTPRETARLRQISYTRQLAAGFKYPGSAGLVVERFGDAEPWVPENSHNPDSKPFQPDRSGLTTTDSSE